VVDHRPAAGQGNHKENCDASHDVPLRYGLAARLDHNAVVTPPGIQH
jgi:hypothetical protein